MERTNYCALDTSIAFFDMPTVRELYATNAEFSGFVFQNTYNYCLKEKGPMMRDVCQGSVYTAVRYILGFCKEKGLPQLTHEQIAFLCSRSRPAVTKAISDIIKTEKDLF